MKIVGIGLNKTGTTSLGACFKHWGFNHISCNIEAFRLWRDSDIPSLMSMVGQYDSFEDWPWPLVYRQIDAAFPGSKFVLTRRANADVWFRSLCKHAQRVGITEYRRPIYGFDMPHGQKKAHTKIYDEHLHSVRQYFQGRNDLLEVCWEEGQGWKELAEFLSLEAPDLPFPHANKSPTLLQSMRYGISKKVRSVLRRPVSRLR